MEFQSKLMNSKRITFACLAMLLMFFTTLPVLGIDPDLGAELREAFLYLAGGVIAGQTVTDVVTKGKTSGNYSGGGVIELVSDDVLIGTETWATVEETDLLGAKLDEIAESQELIMELLNKKGAKTDAL